MKSSSPTIPRKVSFVGADLADTYLHRNDWVNKKSQLAVLLNLKFSSCSLHDFLQNWGECVAVVNMLGCCAVRMSCWGRRYQLLVMTWSVTLTKHRVRVSLLLSERNHTRPGKRTHTHTHTLQPVFLYAQRFWSISWSWNQQSVRICNLLISRIINKAQYTPPTRLIGRKSPIRTHPTLIQRPRSGWPPSNFGMNVISPETRMMGLPYGEEIMIVGRTMWTQSTSDRRTDRQTDGRTELRSQRPCNAERRTVKTKNLSTKIN